MQLQIHSSYYKHEYYSRQIKLCHVNTCQQSLHQVARYKPFSPSTLPYRLPSASTIFLREVICKGTCCRPFIIKKNKYNQKKRSPNIISLFLLSIHIPFKSEYGLIMFDVWTFVTTYFYGVWWKGEGERGWWEVQQQPWSIDCDDQHIHHMLPSKSGKACFVKITPTHVVQINPLPKASWVWIHRW